MFNDTTTMTISEEEREEFLEGVNWRLMTKVGPFLTYFALLMFVGLIGNCVVIAVYYKRYKAGVTRTCVLTMGVVDLATNIIGIPVVILLTRYYTTFTAAWECKLHWGVLSILITFSAVVLVIVAVDRRRLICNRAVGQPRSSLTKVKIAVAIGLGLSFFLALPRFVIMGHKTLTFPGTDITGVGCGLEDRYQSTTFVKVYNGIFFLVFTSLCVAMNVSYVQIGCFLYQHKKTRRQEKPSSGTGDKLSPKAEEEEEEDKKVETYLNVGNDRQQTLSHNSSSNPTGGNENQPKAANLQTPSRIPNSNPAGVHETNHLSNTTATTTTTHNHSTAFNDNVGNSNQQTLSHNPKSNPAVDNDNHFTTTTDNQPNAFINPTHPESGPYVDYSTDSALDSEDESQTEDTSEQTPELTSEAVVSSSPAGQKTPEKRSFYKRFASKASRYRSHRRSKTRGPQGKKIPTGTTLMLCVLSVVFVVNFVPFLVMQMLEEFQPHLTAEIEKNVYFLLSTTQYINSAANPLVYSFCSARFRYECRNLFRAKH